MVCVRPAVARTVSLALVVLLAVTFVPGVAAAEDRVGGSVVVGPDETIDDDLDVAGGSVVIQGTVTGDVSVAAGSVRIDGTIEGDLEVSGGSVELGEEGTVGGNLEAGAGSVLVAGTVGGNAELAAETITLAETAAIEGNLTYAGDLVQEDGARVGGTITEDEVSPGVVNTDGMNVPAWASTVYFLLANAILGVLLLLVMPVFSQSVASRVTDSPLRSGGTGLLALVAVPIALTLLLLTIVGIPLSILGFFLYLTLLWVGAIYGRLAVGMWLLSQFGRAEPWTGLIVGLVVVAALSFVPVVGGLVELAVVLLGLGALSLSLYDRYRGRRGPTVESEVGPAGDEESSPT